VHAQVALALVGLGLVEAAAFEVRVEHLGVCACLLGYTGVCARVLRFTHPVAGTDAGPPGPHPERARGAGLRQPAAGVPQAGHPDDVRDGPAAADARAADLDRHRPGRGRAAVGLRGGQRVPRQGLRRGACASRVLRPSSCFRSVL